MKAVHGGSGPLEYRNRGNSSFVGKIVISSSYMEWQQNNIIRKQGLLWIYNLVHVARVYSCLTEEALEPWKKIAWDEAGLGASERPGQEAG